MATATTDAAKRRKVRSQLHIFASWPCCLPLVNCLKSSVKAVHNKKTWQNTCHWRTCCATGAFESSCWKPFLLQVETMIRSCLISAKEGVGLRVFANDFVSLCGEEVPYREFGTLAGWVRYVIATINQEGLLCFSSGHPCFVSSTKGV